MEEGKRVVVGFEVNGPVGLSRNSNSAVADASGHLGDRPGACGLVLASLERAGAGERGGSRVRTRSTRGAERLLWTCIIPMLDASLNVARPARHL